MSAPVDTMGTIDAADQLFDAVALLSALAGRLHQLESDRTLSVDLAIELSRVVRVISAQVESVATVVSDMDSPTGSTS